ncbi:hypothetical protein G4228_017391 [Cervus hanglu yarkandensis]|nr:hypothetical protein G4228_017391 [Cervus hanglu yarkandensis]
MLRSGVTFASPGGRCQGLYCRLRHQEMRWELSEAGSCRSLEVLGMHGSHAEFMGTTMEQLERINKEINSVKTEVEEKQKMLPRFTSALEELSQSPMASLSDFSLYFVDVYRYQPENRSLFRGLILSLISHTGIYQTERVVQTVTAIKDGQTFDPATSEQKKNTFVCPAFQSRRKALGGLTGIMLYRHLKDYLLTEEQVRENNYPQPNPEKSESILLNPGMTKTRVNDHNNSPVLASQKTCCRCGKIYGVTSTGRHSRTEGCHYHFGRVLSHKVLGSLERRYSCYRAVLGCYAAKGLELTQVTVMDPSLQVVCDTFVKPDEEVIDCNTRFSGVVEDDLKNMKTSVRDVQTILLNLFSADTILIGHSFEQSLLIHTSVVDTMVLFPHPLGLPHKRSRKGLVADCLQSLSSSENATACIELVLWKVKDDLKGKKEPPGPRIS